MTHSITGGALRCYPPKWEGGFCFKRTECADHSEGPYRAGSKCGYSILHGSSPLFPFLWGARDRLAAPCAPVPTPS